VGPWNDPLVGLVNFYDLGSHCFRHCLLDHLCWDDASVLVVRKQNESVGVEGCLDD